MKKILFLLLLVWGVQTSAQQKFPMTTIPESITEPAERAKYLGEHYWEKADFATLSDAALEEGVVELITLFSLYDQPTLKQVWQAAVNSAESANGGLQRLLALCDKYLYGVSSPMYNEDAYRSLLHVA